MGKANETPRQKMIGILYLVLLGLAAMSINTSVLEAFENLTESLKQTTSNVDGNVNSTIKSFEETKLKDEPVRAKPVYERAMAVKKLADQLDAEINDVKKELDEKGGGYNADGTLKNREDIDVTYRIMINGGRAAKLKKLVNDTRLQMLGALPEKERGMKLPLEALDPPARGGIKKDWESINFGEGIPLPAAYTNLAKIHADLKNSEFEIVKRILGEVDKARINFDQFQAVAVAPTSYVIQGQPYTAEVFLTASDSKTQAEVSVGGRQLPIKDGKGVYTGGTSAEGTFTWTGVVRVKNADGKVEEYKTQPITYQVAKPSAVVSADKMNVLYIGVDNPISISAPGITKEKLKISATGGGVSVSGSNGSYMAKVTGPPKSKVTFTVSVDLGNGKVQTLGSTEFRVKMFGTPRARFAGKVGGSRVPAVVLKQSDNRLTAALDDVEFEIKYTVKKFSLMIRKPDRSTSLYSSPNGQITPEMSAALQKVTGGSVVYFDDIEAIGPGGVEFRPDVLKLIVE